LSLLFDAAGEIMALNVSDRPRSAGHDPDIAQLHVAKRDTAQPGQGWRAA
jgi:hypothetical protein